jgi:hypothetical protein
MRTSCSIDREEVGREPHGVGGAELLWRHVPHAADEVVRGREAGRARDLEQARDAEVDELHRGELARLHLQEDVRRLEVAVNDAASVDVAHAEEELLDPTHPDRHRDGPLAAQPRVERLALEALEHDEGLPALEPEAEHAAHVFALDASEEERLAREALAELAPRLVPRLEHLDGDRPPARQVRRGEHARRRPRPQRAEHLEIGDAGRLKGHDDMVPRSLRPQERLFFRRLPRARGGAPGRAENPS